MIMGLSDEEKATLEALTAKSKEPDDDDNFEIEIYDGQRGARVPYRKGRGYLQEHFGIDLDPDPGKASDDGKSGSKGGKGKSQEGKGDQGTGDSGGKEGEAQSYWSRNRRAAS
jgi:hypothetical protein